MAQQPQILMRAPSPYLSLDLVYIEAVSHLHVGVGRSGSVVDLPVQRDENGFPCIYSSSLKGALKTAFLWAFLKKINDLNLSRRAVEALLGPEPEPEESFESSVAILDASLVAMPVRSLKGIYAYVTAPILLKRMLNYSQLLEAASKSELVKDVEDLVKEAESTRIGSGECLCVGDHAQLLAWGNKIILLEELWLDPKQTQKGHKLVNSLGLDKPLLVLDDDTAKYAVERGLMRIARVRLNRGTKTVEEGPWTEEYVPLKTRFVTAFLYKKPPLPEGFVKSLIAGREGSGVQEQRPINDEGYLEALVKLGLLDNSARDEVRKLLSQGNLYSSTSRIAEAVKRTVRDLLGQLSYYVVLGGHETIGKGIVRLRVVTL